MLASVGFSVAEMCFTGIGWLEWYCPDQLRMTPGRARRDGTTAMSIETPPAICPFQAH